MKEILPLFEVAAVNGMNMRADDEFVFKTVFKRSLTDLIKRDHVHRKQSELIEYRASEKRDVMNQTIVLRRMRKYLKASKSGKMY